MRNGYEVSVWKVIKKEWDFAKSIEFASPLTIEERSNFEKIDGVVIHL